MPRVCLILVSLLTVIACAKSGGVLEDVGTHIAAPSAMSADAASGRLYIVNANSKVLYDSKEGSFQVYDISTPLSPVLLNTVETKSFSGQIYLDTASKRAYFPNRYNTDSSATTATLYNVSVDESASEFLVPGESSVGRDAFGITCCYPDRRIWITTSLNELQYADLDSSLTGGSIPLATTLDNGFQMTHAEADHVAVIGSQAFLSRWLGGVMVVNLDEANLTGATPVDYFINDIIVSRGLATDGTLLYVVGEGDIAGQWTRYLAVIDPASIPPATDNTTTRSLSRNDVNMLLATIEVGANPQEVILSTSYAFVTNMDDDTVSVIDLASRTKIRDISVGDEPFSMALYRTQDGTDQYIYVGNLASNTISVIDISQLAVVATYP